MDINDNSQKIFEKIARVNSVIKGFYAGEPPHSFVIKYSKDEVKQTRQFAYLMMLCILPTMSRGIIRSSPYLRNWGIALAVVAIVMSAVSLIAASNMENKTIAVIEGDYITVKGRQYYHCEISELKKGSMNRLVIMSAGRKIASVGKSWDGCIELVKWARYLGIAINDDGSTNAEELQKKHIKLVAVLIVLSLVVVIAIVILLMLL